jgi:hypothetical protein
MFEANKLTLTRWFLSMQQMTQSKNKVSAVELMRQRGVCCRSAWLRKHKIMGTMRVREGFAIAGRARSGVRWTAPSSPPCC